MHPRGHFLCCDILDAHEVCVLTLGTGHGARLHFFAWVYSQFAKKNLVVYAFSFDQCLWIIIDGKWVLAATEFDLGGDRVIILFSPWSKSMNNFCFHSKLSQNFSVGRFVRLVHRFPFDHRS